MADEGTIELSIVAPMYNEQENVERTVRLIQEEMDGFDRPWELVLVNDGSTDSTWGRASEAAQQAPFIQLCGYPDNRGRGHALRHGFSNARGRYVVSTDFDLSYDASHIRRIHETLVAHPEVDIVLGSAYMPGGEVHGVHWKRLLVSRLGNVILRRFLPQPVYTSTCVLRGYRREALVSLPLHSDGKDLHLEILLKAAALGLEVLEIPARLEARKQGSTKSKVGRTVASHLLFCLKAKPELLFLAAGIVLLVAGILGTTCLAAMACRGVGSASGSAVLTCAAAILSGGLCLLGSLLAALLKDARDERVRIESRLMAPVSPAESSTASHPPDVGS